MRCKIREICSHRLLQLENDHKGHFFQDSICSLCQTCFWCIDMKVDMMSMGTGKMMVLLFSAEMLFKVWRYRSCKTHDTWIIFVCLCLSVSVCVWIPSKNNEHHLKCCWGVCNNLSSMSESPACFVLSLRGNNLKQENLKT